MAITFDNLKTEIARVGGFDADDDDTALISFARTGLRRISADGNWKWLRAAFTVTLVEGQHNYDLVGSSADDVAADFSRMDIRSLRFSGRQSRAMWTTPGVIDADLGPEWRDAGTSNGSVEWATRMGTELWLARKPSAAFIADKPTLFGYYWRSESDSDGETLYLPDEFLTCATHAGLAFAGAFSEDDDRSREYLDMYQSTDLVHMRGFRSEVGEVGTLEDPDWMRSNYSGAGDYGDADSY